MSKEYKKYGIRPARKPQEHALLAGTVYVVEPQGKGYAYIRFDESLVEAVGRLLPTGLTQDNPAYLKVMFMPATRVWRVFAAYLRGTTMRILWETTEKPTWLAKVRRN